MLLQRHEHLCGLQGYRAGLMLIALVGGVAHLLALCNHPVEGHRRIHSAWSNWEYWECSHNSGDGVISHEVETHIQRVEERHVG
jgi:hypothetical protein